MTETEIYSRTLMQQAIKKKISLEIFGLVEELHSLDNKKFISDRQIVEWAIHLLYDDYRNGNIKRLDNPVYETKKKSSRKYSLIATYEDVKKFFNVCNNIKHKCMFMFITDFGLSIQEIINLKIEDINLKNGFINIKNSKSPRIIPFLRKSKLRELIASIMLRKKEGYLFRHYDGDELKPYSERIIQIFFNRYKMSAGLPEEIRPYSFRRYYAKRLMENKIDLETIRQLLGHKTLSATKNFIGEDFVNSHLKTMNEAAIKDRLENNRKVLPCFN